MDNIAELISDYQVDEILLASRKLKRKRKIKADCLTPEYRQKMKRMAAKELAQWISNIYRSPRKLYDTFVWIVIVLAWDIWIKAESITSWRGNI